MVNLYNMESVKINKQLSLLNEEIKKYELYLETDSIYSTVYKKILNQKKFRKNQLLDILKRNTEN